MKRGILLIALQLLSIVGFSKKKEPVRPDYSQEKFWIALPTRHDIADTVVKGCAVPEDQANAKVDVFYVYPTVYLSGSAWNGDLANTKLNHKCDQCVMFQATPFNACGKIYAPRYRQAILRSFGCNCPEGAAALDTAYADVKKAFEYYLTHYNNDRPVILAGHSQGALHIRRLLKDFFEGKPLLEKLVAAYAIGFTIPMNYYSDIPEGDSASQTGCVITWNTVYHGVQTIGPYARYTGCMCVNPLTWRPDTALATMALHHGAVNFKFRGIDEHLVEAKVHDNLLWIYCDQPKIFSQYYHFNLNYHVSDVNLFYVNIRENAIVRVNSYFALHEP